MDPALVTLLANAGTAGVVIALILTGLLDPGWVRRKNEKRIEHLEKALDLERQRNGEISGQAGIAVQLLGTIRDLAVERRGDALPPSQSASGHDAGLTWRDLR